MVNEEPKSMDKKAIGAIIGVVVVAIIAVLKAFGIDVVI